MFHVISLNGILCITKKLQNIKKTQKFVFIQFKKGRVVNYYLICMMQQLQESSNSMKEPCDNMEMF